MISVKEFYAWERYSRDTVDFKMIYVDICEDLLAGLLLSQIIYWFTPDRNGKTKTRIIRDDRRWLAKRHSEWKSEIRLTEDQARRALKILEEKGFVVVKVFKFDGSPTTHISLIEQAVLSAIQRFELAQIPDESGSEPNSFWDEAHLVLGSSPERSGTEPRSLTETTTEITTETTTETPYSPPGDGDAKFDLFWSICPKKVGKQAAYKAWKRLTPQQKDSAIADLQKQRHLKDPQWLKNNGQYIPNPATYLNQGRFDDEWQPVPDQQSSGTAGQDWPRRPVETVENRYMTTQERSRAFLARRAQEIIEQERKEQEKAAGF